MKRTPLRRKSAPKRPKKPIRKRNPERRASEFARTYGSEERVRAVKEHKCLVRWCRAFGENAHTATGGTGRKADASTIVPLCRKHHQELHASGQKTFQARYELDLEGEALAFNERWMARVATPNSGSWRRHRWSYKNERDFWAHTEPDENGCWIWKGNVGHWGYGLLSFQGRKERAHRLALKLTVGPPPPGTEACHSCDVRLCCNPAHLRWDTRSANMRDAVAKGRWKGHGRLLTKAQAAEVRELFSTDEYTEEQLATRFGVGIQRILTILHRRERPTIDFPDELAF